MRRARKPLLVRGEAVGHERNDVGFAQACQTVPPRGDCHDAQQQRCEILLGTQQLGPQLLGLAQHVVAPAA
jgi:hypothetical protein